MLDLTYGAPRNLLRWAEENRARLKPPVCNAAIFEDGNYIINLVGGPNTRTDFHDNPTEEIFYQLQGSAYLNIWDRGRFERVDIREGEIFLLPAHVIHSPQRPVPGLCLLVELTRPLGQLDVLQWYCPRCATLVWRASKQLESLVDDLPKIYEMFYATSESERRCPRCGTIHPGRDYAAWHALRAQQPAP
jgi:3-hydroxyanthranilate 3,4-dioxygenase